MKSVESVLKKRMISSKDPISDPDANLVTAGHSQSKKTRVFERSGKWTPEEENFANRLIFEFESGSLDDCENGVTLRSYLARRLHCAPMRISKKFAGRCIGKVRFFFSFRKSHKIFFKFF